MVTLLLAVAAARQHDGSGDYQAGRVVGRMLGAFIIAFAIGLPIQWGVRKRRTIPVWIGAIAVGVSALMLLGAAGQAAAATGAAPAQVYAAADTAPRASLR